MTIEYLENQLESWKRWLLVCLGAAATLLATTIGIERHGYFMAMWGWFIVWFIIQLSAIPAGITLLISSEWRKLPLSARLNTSFGFLAVSWIAWLALAIRGLGTPLFILIFFVSPLGILLALSYWKYHHKVVEQAEELFP